MSLYQDALDATEQHLRALREEGVRFLNVRMDTLLELQQPVPVRRQAQPEAYARAPVSPLPEIRDATEHVPTERKGSSHSQASVSESTSSDKAAAMVALREKVLACVKCPNLVVARKSVVFGVGDMNAKLMFVGEAPGAEEDLQGEPFVGAAGQLLTKIIKAMGFTRETVFIANILKCRPDTPGQTSGNRKPTPAEMQTCIPWLHEQIELIKPVVMVALGGVAVEGLLGKSDGITRLRGHFQVYRGIPIMPTFHPSYLLRNQAITEKRKVWEDMLQVLEKLGEPISEKQRGYFLKA